MAALGSALAAPGPSCMLNLRVWGWQGVLGTGQGSSLSLWLRDQAGLVATGAQGGTGGRLSTPLQV